jgi:hypothetical protein
MRAWCKYLPLVFVRWLALRRCERFWLDTGACLVEPFPGVFFEVKE